MEFTGEFRMVDPRDVVVDHLYQRDEQHGLIYGIARRFRWEAFGAPIVFERPSGVLYLADGQQRVAAIKLIDEEERPTSMPVLVFPVKHVKTEAEIFALINEFRKALTPMEKHKSKVVGEDPAALAIDRAVEKAGFAINIGGKAVHDIHAIGSLNRAYNNLGEDGVYEVLMIHREAWPEEQPTAMMLRLLTVLVAEQGETYDRGKLTNALSGATPRKLRAKAEELKFDMAGSLPQNLRRAVKALTKI